MTNKRLLLILLTIVSLAFIGCGDNNNNNSDDTVTDDDQKVADPDDASYNVNKVLPKLHEHFILKNIDEAKKYSKMLENVTKALCTDGTTATCKHHEDTMEGADCLHLAFLELSEYSTKRLQMFNNFTFQKTVYDQINTQMVELEKLAYSGALPTQGQPSCTNLQTISQGIATGVSALDTAWNNAANKTEFLSANDSQAGIKKVFEGIYQAVTSETETFVAGPAGLDSTTGENDASKDADTSKTEAPTGKLGGWVVYQAVHRGPHSAYVGDYKNTTWKSTLQAYLKATDESKATALDNAFAGVADSMKDFIDHKEPSKKLEKAISDQQWDKLKMAIVALVKLAASANTAAQ